MVAEISSFSVWTLTSAATALLTEPLLLSSTKPNTTQAVVILHFYTNFQTFYQVESSSLAFWFWRYCFLKLNWAALWHHWVGHTIPLLWYFGSHPLLLQIQPACSALFFTHCCILNQVHWPGGSGETTICIPASAHCPLPCPDPVGHTAITATCIGDLHCSYSPNHLACISIA